MTQIAYRRMSGAIGISDHEQGTRGMWWEKRRALVAWLQSRGHQVDYVGRMTKYSRQPRQPVLGPQHSHLIVEFGSRNKNFYGRDLEQTHDDAIEHVCRGGKVVFVCDDPDLPYDWARVPQIHRRHWACWQNATRPQPFGGQPDDIASHDLPLHALMPMRPPPELPPPPQAPAYLGRPAGRKKTLAALLAPPPVDFVVYGRPQEWTAFPSLRVEAPPPQPRRADFYAQQSAALVLADAKHKRLGWRTGRAYHALAAGCLPLVEADHPALAGRMPSWSSPAELRLLIEASWDAPGRLALVQTAQAKAAYDLPVAEAAARAVGL